MNTIRGFATVFFLLIASHTAFAADLICKLEEEILVEPSNLSTNKWRSATSHRISGDKLFINDPSRPNGEYLYGTLVSSEKGSNRYVSGHKTFIFFDEKRTRGIVVHSNYDEVRIAQLSCH